MLSATAVTWIAVGSASAPGGTVKVTPPKLARPPSTPTVTPRSGPAASLAASELTDEEPWHAAQIVRPPKTRRASIFVRYRGAARALKLASRVVGYRWTHMEPA